MKQENKISVFKSLYDIEPVKDITLDTFYNVIRDDIYRDVILRIRAARTKEQRAELKKQLPAATLSGTFTRRRIADIKTYSGRICIDVDASENTKISSWQRLRDQIGKLAEVEFCALSASGKGLFFVLPIAYPEMHLRQFKSLLRDFHALDINIDKSCSDLSRLRFFSWDPDATCKEAKQYTKLYREPEIVHKKRNENELQSMMDMIISSGADITAGYNNWLEVGRALVNEYGESGRSYFHALSRFNPEYSSERCDRQYNACLRSPGKASGNTIFYLAKENNILLSEHPHRSTAPSSGRPRLGGSLI